MRLLANLTTARSLWLSIARSGALALGAASLAYAGPALGDREAPAVWVPQAPGGLDSPAAPAPAAGTPMVLVPFQQTVVVPESGEPPAPWAPDYLAAPQARPQAGPLDEARQAGVLPKASAPAGARPQRAKGAGFTFSDVLREVEWRRETAQRLRAEPDFKPRF